MGAVAGGGSLTESITVLERLADPLSARECQVLELLAQGRSNGEIAAELNLSVSTAKGHLEHLGVKTGVNDRKAIVATALRRGWID